MKISVSGLKKKIKKIGPVEADNQDELLSLIRIMMAEIMKLKTITPPIHTNKELVELFLGRLTIDFAARVANKLAVHRLINAYQSVNPLQGRNPEDMYDIEEVMKMAKHTSIEQSNPFGRFLTTFTNGSRRKTTVKLEEAVAYLTDTLNVQLQQNKAVEQRLNTLQNFINQPEANTLHLLD